MRITPATEIETRGPPRWLIEPRVPSDEVSLLTGARRSWKGTACSAIAAHAARGERLPWDLARGAALPVHQVVWVTSSEDSDGRIKARYLAAGGAESQLTVVALDRGRALDQLRGLLAARPGAKLLILDPLQTAIGRLESPGARERMEALVEITRATATTTIAIRHTTKLGTDGRGRGEIADVVRSELVIGRHPDDYDLIVLGQLDSSYGEGDLVAFRADFQGDSPVLVPTEEDWDDDIQVVDLFPRPPERRRRSRQTRVDRIQRFLREVLASGPLPRPEVLRLGRRRHFTERTMERAADQLGLVRSPQRAGGQFGEAIWSLPPPPPPAPPTPAPAAAPERHTAPPAEAYDLPELLPLMPSATPPPAPRTRTRRRPPAPATPAQPAPTTPRPKTHFVPRPEDPLWRHGLEVE